MNSALIQRHAGKTSSATVTVVVAVLLFACASQVISEEMDPHRPVCNTVHCRKLKSFLKARYCGGSPAGNGPDDGCEIRQPKKPSPGVKVAAQFNCKWDETDGTSRCQQSGKASEEIRGVLIREMRRLGLPASQDTRTYFTVWEPTASGWSFAEAFYQHVSESDLHLCQVIGVIDQSSRLHVLRKVPFQSTDADKSVVTTWSPLDLVDVAAGHGHPYVILEGDAYENHWIEVIRVPGLVITCSVMDLSCVERALLSAAFDGLY